MSLLEERLDVAVRVGELRPSGLRARRLGTVELAQRAKPKRKRKPPSDKKPPTKKR